MVRPRTFAILTALVAGGPTAFGEAPAAPTATAKSEAPTPVGRPEPPATARKYLESGAKLFNKGRFDLARKYLDAAETYRERLTANERIVLDVYREKMTQYDREQREAAAAPATVASATPPKAGPTADARVVAASTPGTPPVDREATQPPSAVAPRSATTTPAYAPSARTAAGRGTESWRDTSDVKQKGRWLLRSAREQIFRGQFDDAARTLAEVQGMNVRWGFFDDNPGKVAETLAKARAKSNAR